MSIPHEVLDAYRKEQPRLEQLRSLVVALINGELSKGGIKAYKISSRVKTEESFAKKTSSKAYDNPVDDCTDLVGIRIVLNLNREIDRASEIIAQLFEESEVHSIDKREITNPAEFGYRSNHIVCSLGHSRGDLPEYAGLCDQLFEVQVRTALQDTWSEIEHKLNYKADRALPAPLQRKLSQVNALLESADDALDSIVSGAEKYVSEIKESTGGLEDAPITQLGALAVIEKWTLHFGLEDAFMIIGRDTEDTRLVEELEANGIAKLGDLEDLLSSSNEKDLREYISLRPDAKFGPTQFVRHALIFRDPAAYFANAHPDFFTAIHEKSVEYLEQRFPKVNLRAVLKDNNIHIGELA